MLVQTEHPGTESRMAVVNVCGELKVLESSARASKGVLW